MSMEKQLVELESVWNDELQVCQSIEDLESVRLKYLGRKSGLIHQLLRALGTLDLEEKKKFGARINHLKQAVQEAVEQKQNHLSSEPSEKIIDTFDPTLPGKAPNNGHVHPITIVMNDIIEIFRGMGFGLATGPEVETDYYNFEALNIPKDHPARDMQDTFYLSDDLVLTTHTSPVQIRVMESQQPPIRIIAPGKVYRRDADVSHTPMFHQVEGLIVDTSITMGNLMSVLDQFLKKIFSKNVHTRFRPSYFSFTEPSAEVDISCVFCSQKGCRVCKGSGWLEILGAGMVDPAVFSSVKYDSEKFTGFAFGLGVERIAMLKYGINDIRLFFENDMRFLRQF